MQGITNRFFWIPFYLLLLFFIRKQFGKKIFLILGIVLLLIFSSDQLSVLIKNKVERYRPCHNTEISNQVHTINGCGGQYGFVSSHASNTFALALFLSLIIRKKSFSILMILWAALVSYSRIYGGVHYPSDILGGALLGLSLAIIWYLIYQNLEKRFSKK